MIITKEWLEEKNACSDGVEWVIENAPNMEGIELVKRLADHRLDWANWLIVRIMTRPQYLAYGIFAAEQVIDIYERKHPNNKNPRLAIEAAKKVLAGDTAENRAAAAFAAAFAADAADAAAFAAAAFAAAFAADAADAAAFAAAAAAAADAADAADADAAYAAAYATRKKMRLKILNYGLTLLEVK